MLIELYSPGKQEEATPLFEVLSHCQPVASMKKTKPSVRTIDVSAEINRAPPI
jgi:hypothetical protein